MAGAIKSKGTPSKDVKYKKPSCAPKRFKSAYMFFSERKHKEFRRREECKKVSDPRSIEMESVEEV